MSQRDEGQASPARTIPIEELVSRSPFVVRRRVAFRDCDPAGVVYTPRFLDPFMTGAADLFIMELIGPPNNRDEGLQHMGTPAKAVEMVFHHPAPLGAILTMTLHCAGISKHTFAVAIEGVNEAGVAVFTGKLTLVCVDHRSFTAVPVPDALRTRLADYVAPSD